jgi:hypothetical protein
MLTGLQNRIAVIVNIKQLPVTSQIDNHDSLLDKFKVIVYLISDLFPPSNMLNLSLQYRYLFLVYK